MTVPRLHAVTDDHVLAAGGFIDGALALLEAHGPALALHLRGHATTGAALFRLAAALAPAARGSGSSLLVNDRLDVALALGCGAQVGRRSLPVAEARALLGPDATLGCSTHGVEASLRALDDGADFVLLGTIWASGSHPGAAAAGPELVAGLVARTAAPVIAIGGVTPKRAAEAVAAGAHGVAAVSGLWGMADPVAAAALYLETMRAAR